MSAVHSLSTTLLTRPQAAQLLGIQEGTLRHYQTIGRLARANEGGHGVAPLYHYAEVERLRGELAAGKAKADRKAERASAPPEAMFLTRYQAAELLGIAPSGVKRYTLSGRLPRANDGGRFQTALYRREDVEALRCCTREGQREQSDAWKREIRETGQRECCICHAVKPLDEFYPDRGNRFAVCGHSSSCKACDAARAAATRKEHPERVRVYWNRWASKKRSHLREKCRQGRLKNPTIYSDRNRRWRERNHDYIAARRAWQYRVRTAVEEGKTSPICRRYGFSVVVSTTGEWRAARLDKPIGANERAMVEYTYFAAGKRQGAYWVVNPPALRSPRALEVTLYCRHREENLAAKAAGGKL